MKRSTVVLAVCIACLLAASSVSAKQWHFGIGTGFAGTKLDGDVGLYSPIVGTIEAQLELDPGDFQDLVSTAFGLGGYATDGDWMVTFTGGYFKLEGDGSGTAAESVPVATNVAFEITLLEPHVGYTAYRNQSGKFTVQPYIGVRYTGHKLTNDLTVGNDLSTIEHDNSWADFLIGTSIGYTFSPQWSWSGSADGGFGGSEGSFNGKTGISWKPLPHFSFSTNVSFNTTEYVNGEKGDEDWYKYDMDQTQFGVGVLFHF